jgi:cysteine desulfuration protein SufE
MKKEYKIEDNLVRGCQSQVWLVAEVKNGNVFFEADSDAIISKGICALLVKVFNGQPALEIVKNNLSFIDEIGLKEHLSPNRSNGLVAMVKKIKAYALVYSTI